MSLAGFKKQLNKANQFMSEKIAGAKGTELDEDYVEMERKVDVTDKLVTELMGKTQEYLQPNPASRAKLMTQAAWSKVRRQHNNMLYPQPEGTLGEVLTSHGKDLGFESGFGDACVKTGETFQQLSELKYALEDSVKQNFLEPLTQLQSTELKEIAHHRKKLAGRRLDYDCKKRKKDKGGQVSEEDMYLAEEKFSESKELAETAMNNLLTNDVEQISQLKAFVEATLDYHQQATAALTSLKEELDNKISEAAGRPKVTHVPKRIASTSSRERNDPLDGLDSNGTSGDYSFGNDFRTQQARSKSHKSKYKSHLKSHLAAPVKKTPSARAVYDFEPENEGELGFSEGDMIELTQRIDDNWFEGKFNGQSGFFPINYVEVVNPL